MEKVYKGIRGKAFVDFLKGVLKKGGLKESYLTVLLDDTGLQLYDNAFTHSLANPTHNYEWLEFLGDTTLNKAIAWYLPQRFPQLSCAGGVKVLTRLKINLISKKSFADFAKNLNFWPYITLTEEVRDNKKTKTLEDVFEAFFGATELLLDTRVRHGIGYEICYTIIKSLLDEMRLSLKYSDIFDSKTRIKELIDYFGDELGELKYVTQKSDRVHKVFLYRTTQTKRFLPIKELLSSGLSKDEIVHQLHLQYLPEIKVHPGEELIGTGTAYLKADAQQQASEQGLAYLTRKGFIKPLTEDYARFCG